VILYTCGQKTSLGSAGHPCGRAADALDDAGYTYEIKTVKGYRLAFWTWANRSKDREEVRRLSGTNEVPILVLDDGEVISGSGSIARWAKEHPRQQAEVGGG
jgi:glutathione S-transferase